MIVHSTKTIYCIDGSQRYFCLKSFVNNEYFLRGGLKDNIIKYSIPVLDEDGLQKYDENGKPLSETIDFNIRGKYFNELPEELQDMILYFSFPAIVIPISTNEELKLHTKRFRKDCSSNNHERQLNYQNNYIESLIRQNDLLKNEIALLKDNHSKMGRKLKFNDSEKQKIIQLRADGKSIDNIKDIMGCSKGLVHKIIHEYDDKKF